MRLLFTTNNPAELAFAEATLASEGIELFILDVHTSALEGSLGILPRRVMVADRDHFAATAILRDLGVLK